MMNSVSSVRSVYPMLDPRWVGRVPFPILNIGAQYVLAVLRSSIPARDKLRCLAAMRGWLRTNWLRCIKTVCRGALEYAKIAVSRSRW